MSNIEKKALSLCSNKILDIGAGAGSHSLYLPNSKTDVTSIDISKGAVEVMKTRGIRNVFLSDYFDYSEKHDTLLLLMNGIGIVGTLDKLPMFFEKAKEILNPNGKIILDSSDIIYLFEDEESSPLDLRGHRKMSSSRD